MKSTKPLAAAAIALACALVPIEASARAYRGMPTASASSVSVNQAGDDNAAVVAQNGRDNIARIDQRGAGNTAQIAQNGTDHRACVFQRGRGLTANVVQDGQGRRTTVFQTNNVTRRGTDQVAVARGSVLRCR